LRGQ
jgi:hypothetical protein